MPRLLFIALEFTAGTFSGNGIYAASQVRALALSGCQLMVLAGKPAGLLAKTTTLAYQLIEVSTVHMSKTFRTCVYVSAGIPVVRLAYCRPESF